MNRVMHGIVRGRTIELIEDPGVLDGKQVEVTVALAETKKNWGDGIRRSAGGWAEYPEMDAVMEKIHQERKRERRSQVAP